MKIGKSMKKWVKLAHMCLFIWPFLSHCIFRRVAKRLYKEGVFYVGDKSDGVENWKSPPFLGASHTFFFCFRAVHWANMFKRSGYKSTRPHMCDMGLTDAVKPDDWVGPESEILRFLQLEKMSTKKWPQFLRVHTVGYGLFFSRAKLLVATFQKSVLNVPEPTAEGHPNMTKVNIKRFISGQIGVLEEELDEIAECDYTNRVEGIDGFCDSLYVLAGISTMLDRLDLATL